MATTSPVHSSMTNSTTPLIEEDDVVDGSVDYKGNPVRRSRSGGWRSASSIIVMDMAESFAYYGICSNLITYLTGPLGQSTATAAENVNIWSGTSLLLPLLGALVADSFLGRYRTIIVSSLIYLLGISLLTLSAVLTSMNVAACGETKDILACSSPQWLVNLLFFSLYLIAVGQGGHKPCVQSFGADQFDGQHPKESKSKSSFFNWWNFTLSAGTLSSQLILVYIQEKVSWALGFGIPAMVMVAALFIFLLRRTTYRYSDGGNEKYPFLRIVRAFKGSRAAEKESHEQLKDEESICRAIITTNDSVDEVEEAKGLLRLAPIWLTSLTFAISLPQSATFFTKQGATMDRTIFPGYQIPAASLQSLVGATAILFVPIYDIIFVPVMQSLTGKSSGITMLQRIGTGMVLSAVSMGIAALVEAKRLETAKEYGFVDLPNLTLPMSVVWLVPQYVVGAIAYVFVIVGLQEFFYEEVPKELRSVGISLYCTVLGIGCILSSLLVSIIDRATSGDNEESWFSDNLNKAHLDYFYWLLAGLSFSGFTTQLYFTRSFRSRHLHHNTK